MAPQLNEDDWLEWEEKQESFAFFRSVERIRRSKNKEFRADCGHLVDGSRPYRYTVYRIVKWPKGKIEQRTDCETCARSDKADWKF